VICYANVLEYAKFNVVFASLVILRIELVYDLQIMFSRCMEDVLSEKIAVYGPEFANLFAYPLLPQHYLS